jgi:hypothetical protein
LVAISVRLDQTPGEICWADGCSVDSSTSRVLFQLDRDDRLPELPLVIGVALPGQPRQFAFAKIQSQRTINGVVRVAVEPRGNTPEDLFCDQNLTPHIDVNRFQFTYGVSADAMRLWESIGVLRKYLVDRVLVCPACGSLPTWRYGCPHCGSARYNRDRLIHHFACAHVDHADAFQIDEETLRCPKCRATRLIAGTDFQYVPGPLNCFDCRASGVQGVLCCLCHQCQNRFDAKAANELDLYGYHFDRLDLLDIVAASQ